MAVIDLRRRLERMERERKVRSGAVRYLVSDVPLDDDGLPIGESRVRPMSDDEWIATHCREQTRH